MTKRSATTIDSVAEDDHVWVLDREGGQARDLTGALDRRCGHVRWGADGIISNDPRVFTGLTT